MALFQTQGHCLQYFARELFIGYGAGESDGTDEREKVKTACDLVAVGSVSWVSRIRVASNSMSSRICRVTRARVSLLLRAISGAKALNGHPVPGLSRCASLKYSSISVS